MLQHQTHAPGGSPVTSAVRLVSGLTRWAVTLLPAVTQMHAVTQLPAGTRLAAVAQLFAVSQLPAVTHPPAVTCLPPVTQLPSVTQQPLPQLPAELHQQPAVLWQGSGAAQRPGGGGLGHQGSAE